MCEFCFEGAGWENRTPVKGLEIPYSTIKLIPQMRTRFIPLEIGSAPLVLRGNTFYLCYYFVKYSYSRVMRFRRFTPLCKIFILYMYVHSICEKQTDVSLMG